MQEILLTLATFPQRRPRFYLYDKFGNVLLLLLPGLLVPPPTTFSIMFY